MRQIPKGDHLPAWVAKVKARDLEWDEKLRKLYPPRQEQESDKEFDDAIPLAGAGVG
jgi:hypothetical protein